MKNLRFAFLAGGLCVALACATSAWAQAPAAPAAPEAAAPDAMSDQAAAPAKKAVKKRKVVAKKKARRPAAAKAMKAGSGQVLITNQRSVGLVSLTLTSTTDAEHTAQQVARDIPAGGKVVAKIPPKTGCVFNVSGEFDDGSTLEASDVEVCKVRELNLVE